MVSATEATGAIHLAEVLRLIGRGNLSLGRLYEAHVNVLRLIARYGTDRQMQHAADLVLDGKLFGLWVTDALDAQVYLTEDFVLHGMKAPCSGAGHVRHALDHLTATGRRHAYGDHRPCSSRETPIHPAG